MSVCVFVFVVVFCSYLLLTLMENSDFFVGFVFLLSLLYIPLILLQLSCMRFHKLQFVVFVANFFFVRSFLCFLAKVYVFVNDAVVNNIWIRGWMVGCLDGWLVVWMDCWMAASMDEQVDVYSGHMCALLANS